MEYILARSDITEEGAFEKPLSEFTTEESEMLRVRPISIEDVRVALNEFGSTTTGDSIKTFDDWYRAFGTGGKKKDKKNEDKQPNQSYRQRDGRTGDLARYLLDCLRNFGGNSELELARHLFDWLRDFQGDSRTRDTGVNLGRYLLDCLLDY